MSGRYTQLFPTPNSNQQLFLSHLGLPPFPFHLPALSNDFQLRGVSHPSLSFALFLLLTAVYAITYLLYSLKSNSSYGASCINRASWSAPWAQNRTYFQLKSGVYFYVNLEDDDHFKRISECRPPGSALCCCLGAFKLCISFEKLNLVFVC